MTAFLVVGTPASKGSARAIKRGAFAVLVASGSNANRRAIQAWEAAVSWSAKAAARGAPPLVGPVAVTIWFRFARPASHGKRQRAIDAHATKPDLDKIARCTLDALTGILFVDDAQVSDLRVIKSYCRHGEKPGATIGVMACEGDNNTPAEPARSTKR